MDPILCPVCREPEGLHVDPCPDPAQDLCDGCGQWLAACACHAPAGASLHAEADRHAALVALPSGQVAALPSGQGQGDGSPLPTLIEVEMDGPLGYGAKIHAGSRRALADALGALVPWLTPGRAVPGRSRVFVVGVVQRSVQPDGTPAPTAEVSR